jgi:hypothetical protein
MDLFELIKSMNDFFLRRLKLMMVFVIAGLLLGWVYDMTKTPYYETAAVATSGLSYFEGIVDPNDLHYPIIDQKIAIDIVNAVGDIVKSQEYQILADKLGIPLEAAQAVTFLEAEQLYELDLENRRQKLSQFSIILRTKDNTTISVFQEGLKNYFSNNGYSDVNYALFKQQVPELIKQIDNEILALEDYRSHLKTKNSLETSSISIANNRSELVQNQIIQLFEHKQSLERNLTLLKPLSYVSQFPVYEKPKDRTMVRLLIFGLLFFFVGFVVAIFKELNSATA